MALENRRFLSPLPPPSPCLRGGKEGGDLRLQLERASLRGRSSPCFPFPPPRVVAACPLRPPCAARVREGRKRGQRGAGEAGGWTRVRRQLLPDPCIPAPRVLAGPASAAAAAAAAGRDLEGAGAARRGRDRPSRR